MAPKWNPEELGRRLRERRFKEALDDPPECTLPELRKSSQRTQTAVADILGVRQLAVSRLERRPDVLLSTLASYVAALGGNLELIVRFPTRAVRLSLRHEGSTAGLVTRHRLPAAAAAP